MGRDLLAHRVEGDGEPLLLLNGGMMTYAAWEPVSSRLCRRFSLVLCDLRGQLLSPGHVSTDLEDNVEDLEDLLDHLGIESTHVMGTSYGGEVGLLTAARLPARVRSLVAVTVSDYATSAIRQGAEDLRQLVHASREGGDRRLIHDRLAEEVYSASYLATHGTELAARREQMGRLPDSWFEGLEGILGAVEELDVRSCLSDIRCPTLVVIAGEDRSIPPERSRALAAAVSGAETRTHETSGHALVAEDPRWLAEVTLEFLERRASATGLPGSEPRRDTDRERGVRPGTNDSRR
jgi:pimeloyl-ACP methyl ester carboxylesterase